VLHKSKAKHQRDAIADVLRISGKQDSVVFKPQSTRRFFGCDANAAIPTVFAGKIGAVTQ
jgi:hypothetical protein